MKAKKQDDVLDVIYDSWYSLPLDKADKVIYDYVHRELIPIEWLKKHGAHLVTMPKRKFDSSNMAFLFTLIKDWEDENGTENN